MNDFDDTSHTNGGPEVVSSPSATDVSLGFGGELVLQRDREHDHGMIQKEHMLKELADKQFPLVESELIVRAFQKTVVGKARASFCDGIQMQEVVDEAAEPRIGITFMAGADTAQVNQLEQMGMTQSVPDQKDASWRINTAGALLKNFEVDSDMSIVQTDNTPTVIAKIRKRRAVEDGPLYERNVTSQALTRRGREERTVTIDSDNVKIVNDLSSGKWDLESTLIEVDQSSLVDLIFNYRHLIHRGGPLLTFGDTIKLLDMMIEDARRLCVRSPILFRMSTRRHIISSKNTRYGVDHGTMFQTLTTSSGIKNIISLSAAYFNSLASSGNTDKSQALIRPRFLQMLVLLLSLLNDDDLGEISEFLESTYGICAERQHVELLILKVLPLMSINSKIFLNAMVVAFEGPFVNPNPTSPNDQKEVWNTFVQRMLQKNYILPGTVEQVGQSDLSWIMTWPKDGIKDSHVFNDLQFGGEARTINDIPSINLHFDNATEELAVILTNNCKYIVASSEIENIIRMTAGKYSITEVDGGARTFDLDITEMVVSEPLSKAIFRLNSLLGVVNGFIAAPRRNRNVLARSIGSIRSINTFRTNGGSNYSNDTPFPEIKASGRLTFNMANLNDSILAVAYKVEGRKITRRDLIRNLASDLRKIRQTVHAVDAAIADFDLGRSTNSRPFSSGGSADIRQTIHSLRVSLSEINGLVVQAEENKARMEGHLPQLGDEPVSKVLYPSGAERGFGGADDDPRAMWHDYRAWYVKSDNVLFVDAQRRTVQSVSWLNLAPASDHHHHQQHHHHSKTGSTLAIGGVGGGGGSGGGEIAELVFHGYPEIKHFVSPLRPVTEVERADEIKERDRCVLVGGFVVVVEAGDPVGPAFDVRGDPAPVPESVVNWLKITGIEQQVASRRGRNKRKEVEVVRSVFR